MRRRTALTALGSIVTAGLSGCIGDDPGEASTPTATDASTESPTPTDAATETPPTETPSGPYVEYLVYNDDDRTHPLDVTIENADGEVVHRRRDTEFEPGEQLGATSSGYDPENGPFPITFALESLAQTIEWKVDECPRFDVLVAVDSDGQLEVEREHCIK